MSILEFVRTLLVMSLSGSAVALLLFAIKPLVRHRISKSVQYSLWLIALLVMLIPVSRLVILPPASESAFVAPIYKAVERSIVFPQEVRTEQPAAQQAEPSTGEIPAADSSAPSPNLTLAAALTAFAALYPWIILLCLLYHAFCYGRFLLKTRRCHLPASAYEEAVLKELCGSRTAPRLRRNTKAGTPMLIGVFRPVILLPDRDYTEQQPRRVLLHECTHLRRQDVAVKWLTLLACSLHWFNPVVWLLRREIDRSCELACDERVLNALSLDGKKAYGSALLAVAADAITPRTVLSTTMCLEKRALQERLTAIMKHRKTTRTALICSAVMLAAVLCTACVLAAGSANEAPVANTAAPVSTAMTLRTYPPVPTPIVAAQAAASTPAPFQLLGQDDLLLDFTILLPSSLEVNAHYREAYFQMDGSYAGKISLQSYWPGDPYNTLMDNHTERIGDWEETTVDFNDDGPWRKHLKHLVIGRFESDDWDDPHSGRVYEHTIYYLIFDKLYTGTNVEGEYEYHLCYSIDLVTANIDEAGNRFPLFDEETILNTVKTFALKEEFPYQTFMSFDEMEQKAGETMRLLLLSAETPEAKRMYESLGSLSPNDFDDLSWSSLWMKASGGKRIINYEYESDAMKGTVVMDMDTGEVLRVKFEEEKSSQVYMYE